MIGGRDRDLMTPRRRGYAQWRTPASAPSTTRSSDRPSAPVDDGMATPPLPALTIVSPPSEYGSDIDTLTAPASDYGSEFDIEEETLIGDLLTQISATAPIEKTVIYRGQDAEAPEVLLHSSPPSALVRLATDASVELSPRRARSAPVEVEYDHPSREAWSRMSAPYPLFSIQSHD